MRMFLPCPSISELKSIKIYFQKKCEHCYFKLNNNQKICPNCEQDVKTLKEKQNG